jgi:hypothetical protein
VERDPINTVADSRRNTSIIGGHALSQFLDHTDALVSQHDRARQGHLTAPQMHVGPTHAAHMDAQHDLTRLRRKDRTLPYLYGSIGSD